MAEEMESMLHGLAAELGYGCWPEITMVRLTVRGIAYVWNDSLFQWVEELNG